MPISAGDTRKTIGGTSNDLALRKGIDGALYIDSGNLVWWTQETGGIPLADLLLNGNPVTSINVPRNGEIPRHQWPEGISEAWASVDHGPRMLFVAGTAGPAGAGVPAGGTTGQVLAKASPTSLDVTWVDPAAGGTVPDADTSTKGKVELATAGETTTGTDTGRAVTPAGVKAALGDLTSKWGVIPTIYINADGTWPGRVVPDGYTGPARWDSGTTANAAQPGAAVERDRWLRKKP